MLNYYSVTAVFLWTLKLHCIVSPPQKMTLTLYAITVNSSTGFDNALHVCSWDNKLPNCDLFFHLPD